MKCISREAIVLRLKYLFLYPKLQVQENKMQNAIKNCMLANPATDFFDKAIMQYEMHQQRSNSIKLEVSVLSN